MTTLTAQNPTLLDLAKRSEPDGKIATIVEVLNLQNDALTDISFIEGNLPTGNRTTVRTGIPNPTWRRLYGGVQPTKSTTAQVTDNTGMLEAYSEVDVALADLNGNTSAFRLSESLPHIEGMNQEVMRTLFYGNEGTLPESFTGLAPRFNLSTAGNGDQIIKADGLVSDTTGLQSIWCVVWGPNTVHGIVPKGSVAGLKMEDKGRVTIENVDGSGGRMEAYRTHFRWDVGLTVRDWRYVVRIPNIKTTALTKDAATGADLADLMFQAIERLPTQSLGRPVFYASRGIWTYLRRQVANKTKESTLTWEDVGGKKIMAFQGVPIRRCDSLNTDETFVA